MLGNSSAEKSARAKKQLRDSKGRWIEMGSLVKWYDSIDQKEFSGIVTDLQDDGRAVINRTDRPGGFVARVQAHLLEAIDEKATLKAPAKSEAPAIPTKTVKATKESQIDGFNVRVNQSITTIEKPDGYGGGNVIALSPASIAKLDKALADGTTGSVDLGSGTTAHIGKDTVGFRSQDINPNDGTPGPLNMLVTSKDGFKKISEASKQPLDDKEVPDYSKVPKVEQKAPEVPKAAPFKPPTLAPRHKLSDGSSKIEITDKKVSIFTEDGYGTGDAVSLKKDSFKKVIEAYKNNPEGKIEVDGETVTFKPDGSVNFYSRYVNPNDGSFGPASSVTVSAKGFKDIMDKIDEPLTASLWSETDIIAQDLPVGSTLASSNDIVLKKVSEEVWEYQTASNKISYNNRSIDCFKSLDVIGFTVETN